MSDVFVQIDFESEKAIYQQLVNQIILQIANEQLQDGDSLPSVRHMAEVIGINMHTVYKAYGLLQQQGFVAIDNRKGVVVSVAVDREETLRELYEALSVPIARCQCKQVTRGEVHALVDKIFDSFES